MLDMNDCQLHLMEASFGAREIVCCVVVAVICCVSSPRWHYKCINCTAARIRHPTCHKMCSLEGFRSLKVFWDFLTLMIWRVSDSHWRQWVNLGTSGHIETLALKIKMTIDPTVLHSWNCWKTYTDVLLDKFYIFFVLTIFGSLLTCLIRLW